MIKPRVIAFYLPQFHPTANNDLWHGKGFTEWTSVVKAKKLFIGHEQPHIPADLGFYDLRLSIIREEQAKLAREYGVEGFCYYHYWFAPGKRELSLPFSEVLYSGKPDFPFMLCWANETWQKKFWKLDNTYTKKDLIIQTYGGVDDYTKHFYDILDAFKDPRYITIDNKPVFMIYKAMDIPNLSEFIQHWQYLALVNGLDGIYFIAQSIKTEKEKDFLFKNGIDAINSVRHYDNFFNRAFFIKLFTKIFRTLFRTPIIRNYKKIYKTFINDADKCENIFPTLIPNWDHTPRSGRGGYVIRNSRPEYFRKHVNEVFSIIKEKKAKNRIVFIKSWNEWGEGNYMEPDIKFGRKYLEALKNEMDNF